MQFKDNTVWRFFAERNISNHTYDLWWMATTIQGESLKREVTEMIQVKGDGSFTGANEPTFRITHEEAQSLMDEMWHAGCRPSKEPDFGQEEKKAMQAHINSLQKALDHFMSFSYTAITQEVDVPEKKL